MFPGPVLAAIGAALQIPGLAIAGVGLTLVFGITILVFKNIKSRNADNKYYQDEAYDPLEAEINAEKEHLLSVINAPKDSSVAKRITKTEVIITEKGAKKAIFYNMFGWILIIGLLPSVAWLYIKDAPISLSIGLLSTLLFFSISILSAKAKVIVESDAQGYFTSKLFGGYFIAVPWFTGTSQDKKTLFHELTHLAFLNSGFGKYSTAFVASYFDTLRNLELTGAATSSGLSFPHANLLLSENNLDNIQPVVLQDSIEEEDYFSRRRR